MTQESNEGALIREHVLWKQIETKATSSHQNVAVTLLSKMLECRDGKPHASEITSKDSKVILDSIRKYLSSLSDSTIKNAVKLLELGQSTESLISEIKTLQAHILQYLQDIKYIQDIQYLQYLEDIKDSDNHLSLYSYIHVRAKNFLFISHSSDEVATITRLNVQGLPTRIADIQKSILLSLEERHSKANIKYLDIIDSLNTSAPIHNAISIYAKSLKDFINPDNFQQDDLLTLLNNPPKGITCMKRYEPEVARILGQYSNDNDKKIKLVNKSINAGIKLLLMESTLTEENNCKFNIIDLIDFHMITKPNIIAQTRDGKALLSTQNSDNEVIARYKAAVLYKAKAELSAAKELCNLYRPEGSEQIPDLSDREYPTIEMEWYAITQKKELKATIKQSEIVSSYIHTLNSCKNGIEAYMLHPNTKNIDILETHVFDMFNHHSIMGEIINRDIAERLDIRNACSSLAICMVEKNNIHLLISILHAAYYSSYENAPYIVCNILQLLNNNLPHDPNQDSFRDSLDKIQWLQGTLNAPAASIISIYKANPAVAHMLLTEFSCEELLDAIPVVPSSMLELLAHSGYRCVPTGCVTKTMINALIHCNPQKLEEVISEIHTQVERLCLNALGAEIEDLCPPINSLIGDNEAEIHQDHC